MDAQALSALRAQLIEICAATCFLFAGLITCAIAGLRRRGGERVFLWLGVWSAVYGVQHLLGSSSVVSALPHRLQLWVPYIATAITYLMVVVGAYAWLGLLVGVARRIVTALIVAASITAALGFGWFLATGVPNKFLALNNLLASCVLAILVALVSSKRLFQKYLLLSNRGFLAFGTFVFAIEALWNNLARPFGLASPILLDHLGFAMLLLGFGYSALQMVLKNEHRLLAIESELEIARQIQSSILPTTVPTLRSLQIAVTYQPMASVAGDFYEFLPVDSEHAGFLIADVCGHGVPAALIASMLKVAAQSVASSASDPAEFLAALNRILAAPLRGQLVSAAYLWIDLHARHALYSAAGHPPLLRWHNAQLDRIESNGILFGVLPDAAYPAQQIPLCSGDRLLLYTDGITEPENAAGEAFGDHQLEALLRQPHTSTDLASRIVAELRNWQPIQQDDMTLLVIDVL